ncbi:transglutaminase-like cysteine peptidase [Desulfovibrio sp.]|uniref:transglutaminase-like cysteine peptidase n=1 Tax=Desulfovibrio sp. TaxID=885 RepID=UPI0025C258EB|nr:transglutaminase-like cysteine peptidase [Desulfovibrio sp.]
MKHSRILRASIIITLLVAVLFFLSVLAWRHFTPAIARAEQGQRAEIAAGSTIGDAVAPERPLSASRDSVDDVPPASLAEDEGQPQPLSFESGADLPDAVSLSETDAASVQENDGDAQKQSQVAEQAKTSADAGSSAPEASTAPSSKVQLFGTVEFKRPLSSLPGWLDVLKRNKKDPIFIPGKYFKKSVTWDSFKKNAQGKNTMELLRYVNSFWNTWPYKEDLANWGVEDYWAIPAEFLKKSGDCEDYAIVKYFTLKELGIPAENMRIVVVRDTLRNLAHAVLAVYLNGDAYILDNLSNTVLSHSKIRQYSPQYSVNESGRWAHLKGRKLK